MGSDPNNERLKRPPERFIPEAMHDHTVFYMKKKGKLANERVLKILTLMGRYYPNSVLILNSFGALYGRTGEWERVLPYLLRACDVAPNDGLVWLNAGKCHEKLGKKGEAVSCYERVIEIDAELSIAQQARAYLKTLKK